MTAPTPASLSTPSRTPEWTPGLRRYLHLTAMLSGAAVLVVEILGAKMLAPFVGTSHFVWTAQIAVTLVSLAFGYQLGGWAADRTPKLGLYYTFLAAAGLALVLCMPLVEPMAYACLKFPLPLAALLCSAGLFVVPLTLMATTVPFLIRVMARSVENVGSQAGRLSAISTLGSVGGAVMIGYVLLPLLPNSITLGLTAALLAVLGLIYALIWGRAGKHLALPVATLFVSAAMTAITYRAESHPRFKGMKEIARHNSNFGQLQVLEGLDSGDPRRIYLNDYLVQNTYDRERKQSTSLFTFMLHGLAKAYTEKLDRALCIGLGIGIVPMQLAREGTQVDVVEINPDVIPLAQRYFDFDPALMKIAVGDGRQYLNQGETRYDAVILDAFLGDSSPSHLMTREAFAAMRRRLEPHGVLVINSFGDFAAGADFFVGSIDQTLRAVFKQVRIHASGNGNVFFVASDRENLSILRTFDFDAVYGGVRHQARDAFSSVRENPLGSGRVLTDDFNPVDFYDAVNREKMRRNLAIFVRGL
ncbi:MAG: methyltransferase domain-containing protein [Verrucomicrobia bacterium]|nr:methyltransferase domain-containing protein [Verrucomicrobiota bacterium]